MSGGAEFSNERPKGDAWGIEDAVARAAKEFLKTGRTGMIPCIAVIGVKTVKVSAGDDGPIHTPVVAIKRIDALANDSAIKTAQRLILQAITERNEGKGVEMLPFDEKQVITEAFGGVDSEELALDERELTEDEGLTDPDRLRRHLVKVHQFDAAEVDQMEMFDVQKTHQSAHDPLSVAVMPHDVEWWAWRDIIIRERAAELRADGVTWGEPTEEAEEIDDEEELRLHLGGVHDFSDVLLQESLSDLQARHVRDHEDPDPEEPFPPHDVADRRPTSDGLDSADPPAEDDETAADAAADERD